jgi:uncharacterized protein YraI
MKIARYVILVGLVFGLNTAAADAKPARMLDMFAMRASPAWSYRIVAVVPRGALVDARYCISNGWCRVKWRDKLGWVKAESLRTRLLRRKSR